jgi:(R,R)-butanediol dehydrogenase/meso-butanediol dehydrogenase/diacetyl reductase
LNEVCISTSKVHVCDVDLPDALALLETRDLSPVLDDVIGLDDVVEGGLERLARGEARGKIVVAANGAGPA